MSLKLTNLLSYKTYFADIAAQHIDIAGFKYGDKKVVQNDNRSDITVNFLWVLPYDRASYNDSFSDNTTKSKVARVLYMEARDSKKFEDEDEQLQRCEDRMEEIIARILRDKRGLEVDGEWQMIATSINSMTIVPVEDKIGSTTYLGYQLDMTFMDNANLAFEATKWNDTLTS